LFASPLRAKLHGYEPSRRIAELMDQAAIDDPVSQAQYADLKTYLVGDILTKVDRTSMATSLEVRPPLLDYEFVEWAMTLPSSLLLRRGRGKFILKRALEDRVPLACLYRPKQGFAGSLAGEFRGAGATRVRKRLLGDAMLDSGLFDRDAIARLIDDH